MKLNVHATHNLLGLSWKIRELTVSITPEFRAEVVHLLNTSWHDSRESFDIKELEMLVGKLGKYGQGFCSIFHMMPSLYAWGAFALRENNDLPHSTHNEVYKVD